MKPCCEYKDASYGSEIFCKACGMDIDLKPVKVFKQGKLEFFCCEVCAS